MNLIKAVIVYRNFILSAIFSTQVLLSISQTSFSQPSQIILPVDSSELTPFRKNLDLLLNQWYIGKMTIDSNVEHLNKNGYLKGEIPKFADSVYAKRLAALQSPIPLDFNAVVKRYIEVYAFERRKQVENMLGLGVYYFPIFEQELDKAGLPLELKYIPVIESALNNSAVSKSGATGLWQFIYNTARLYQLQMTSYIDERRDPFKLTQTAVLYLKDLYSVYQDWLLVIAAYNCGPGAVNKAIEASGYKADFWAVYPYLPQETRGYIPAFIAANYIMNYWAEHNLYPKNIYNPGLMDTVLITKKLRFDVIAEALRMPVEQIRQLNPQYKLDLIPQSTTGSAYVLRLPIEKATRFHQHRDLIYRYQAHIDELETTKETLIEEPRTINPYIGTNAGTYSLVEYVVKPEDNLLKISQWFDCTTSDITRWNTLPGNVVYPGKKLCIYVPSAKAPEYRKINDMTFDQKEYLVGNPATPVQPIQTEKSEDGFLYYTVQPGDSLWGIARKFPGVSPGDLLTLNNMVVNESLKPGQKIKVKSAE